jgi:hypothetical protein
MKKIAQNVAQPVFAKINTHFSVGKKSPKNFAPSVIFKEIAKGK